MFGVFLLTNLHSEFFLYSKLQVLLGNIIGCEHYILHMICNFVYVIGTRTNPSNYSERNIDRSFYHDIGRL